MTDCEEGVVDTMCAKADDNAESASYPSLQRRNSLSGLPKRSRTQNSSFFTHTIVKEIPILKNLSECEDDEVMDVLFEKINVCLLMFDFTNLSSDIKGKEIKRNTIFELARFLQKNPDLLTQAVYDQILSMIGRNILRVLPPYENKEFDFEEDLIVYEASWPHLQPIYNLFISLLEMKEFDVNMASRGLTREFLYKMVELFNSEDPRERDCLKTLLHRIYGKFLSLRNDIRQMINHVFLSFTQENEKFVGISELLEIYGSIINGFALPLKEEHKKFLVLVLLPLHKNASLHMYYGQLSYCVLQFIEKEPECTKMVISSLVRYWPKVSSQKELLFLSLLEDILEIIPGEIFEQNMQSVFKRIALCCKSEHFQVSEKALYLWHSDYFMRNFCENSESVIPLVFDALYYASTKHWNQSINSIAISIFNSIIDVNQIVCARLGKAYRDSLPVDDESQSNFTKFLEDFTNLSL